MRTLLLAALTVVCQGPAKVSPAVGQPAIVYFANKAGMETTQGLLVTKREQIPAYLAWRKPFYDRYLQVRDSGEPVTIPELREALKAEKLDVWLAPPGLLVHIEEVFVIDAPIDTDRLWTTVKVKEGLNKGETGWMRCSELLFAPGIDPTPIAVKPGDRKTPATSVAALRRVHAKRRAEAAKLRDQAEERLVKEILEKRN